MDRKSTNTATDLNVNETQSIAQLNLGLVNPNLMKAPHFMNLTPNLKHTLHFGFYEIL